jgi:uncharacterized membrane protein YqaE (UPF0057 family)
MVNKILATVISFFLPGIGELIQGGDTKKSIILFALFIIFWLLTSMVNQYISILSFILAVYAAYDTYQLEA